MSEQLPFKQLDSGGFAQESESIINKAAAYSGREGVSPPPGIAPIARRGAQRRRMSWGPADPVTGLTAGDPDTLAALQGRTQNCHVVSFPLHPCDETTDSGKFIFLKASPTLNVEGLPQTP